MRSLSILLTICFTASIHSQTDLKPVLISNTNWDFVYRAYDNPFEFANCNDCDTVKVIATGGTVNRISGTEFTVRPKPNVRELVINLVCKTGGKDLVLSRDAYQVHLLPNPTVYLGGINLPTDLERTTDAALYNQKYFTARYDENTPIIGVKFEVIRWSITVGRKTFTGGNKNLTPEWKKAFLKACKRKDIIFNYCLVVGPDGYKRKITWNALYHKKVGRNRPNVN